ncbi:two-pore potassium channel 1 [Euphorbia lathyris]|uniref:two-pore potassium channel 1 n=1 Tax=Euphorbia lathyris TaxID=212925 RepID=UPI00331379D2
MASNGVKQPLLPGPVDSNLQTNSTHARTRRRFRRIKSAPPADYVPSDIVDDVSLKRPESIFGSLHTNIRIVGLYLGIYLGVGTLCFYLVRDDIEGTKTSPIIDAVYFCVVTMTTVGYGDLVPKTSLVKILASIFVFSGMAIGALMLSRAADYLVEKQELLLVNALNRHKNLGLCKSINQIESNRVRYKCILAVAMLSFLMVIGTIFLLHVEGMDPIDAIYCVCSTITTLGYGDQSFSTRAGRVFAIFWIMISTLILGLCFLYVAEVLSETKQKALVNWVLTRKTTNVDLEAADIDDDGVVGASEFVVYKLKEMGKITEQDISLVMEEFENLDVDDSGTLSVSDLALAQTRR